MAPKRKNLPAKRFLHRPEGDFDDWIAQLGDNKARSKATAASEPCSSTNLPSQGLPIDSGKQLKARGAHGDISNTSMAFSGIPIPNSGRASSATPRPSPLPRSDLHEVRGATKGSKQKALEAARDEPSKKQALIDLAINFYSAGSASQRSAAWNTWKELHEAWFGELDPVPLTVEKVYALAAMFRKGEYRSFDNYLSVALTIHQENDFEVDPGL